jgi:hypothetical protein
VIVTRHCLPEHATSHCCSSSLDECSAAPPSPRCSYPYVMWRTYEASDEISQRLRSQPREASIRSAGGKHPFVSIVVLRALQEFLGLLALLVSSSRWKALLTCASFALFAYLHSKLWRQYSHWARSVETERGRHTLQILIHVLGVLFVAGWLNAGLYAYGLIRAHTFECVMMGLLIVRYTSLFCRLLVSGGRHGVGGCGLVGQGARRAIGGSVVVEGQPARSTVVGFERANARLPRRST